MHGLNAGTQGQCQGELKGIMAALPQTYNITSITFMGMTMSVPVVYIAQILFVMLPPIRALKNYAYVDQILAYIGLRVFPLTLQISTPD